MTYIGSTIRETVANVSASRWKARDVVAAHIDRIEEVNDGLNAVVIKCFDQALEDAARIDQQVAAGEPVGPLAGVPVTIKECFHVAGTASTIGITTLNQPHRRDNPIVQRMREAGAVILGKTNIPQLMIWHECVNPVYGRSIHPLDSDRTPGGSSGGEAAIIASQGSMLGLGSDLGGSLRVPSHFCGIHTIKPTERRLPIHGCQGNLHGMESMLFQPGPMSRSVDDLAIALRVMNGSYDDAQHVCDIPAPLGDPEEVAIENLKIVYFEDDGYFTPSPAIRRATREAADQLASAGATVKSVKPLTDMQNMVDLYYGVLAADGGKDLRRLLKGSEVDPAVKELLMLGHIPRWSRWLLKGLLSCLGQGHQASLMQTAKPLSADEYWQISHRVNLMRAKWDKWMIKNQFDVILCPPFGVPAIKHGDGVNLLAAASYAFHFNVLGIPAGVVTTSIVGEEEESDRAKSRDKSVKAAANTEQGSAGLPVGVQVAARAWREDVVLAVMKTLSQMS